ncbi:MAG: hypothetical protein ACR2OE_08985 [Thermomicrobiales bacterium]
MTDRDNDAKYQSLWIPDNPDGSGWADVDWVSAAQGSKYHYRHGEPVDEANGLRPRFYRIVTRLETEKIVIPHENSYYIAAEHLADFIAELVWNGGAETIWHIEPCAQPPEEAHVTSIP